MIDDRFRVRSWMLIFRSTLVDVLHSKGLLFCSNLAEIILQIMINNMKTVNSEHFEQQYGLNYHSLTFIIYKPAPGKLNIIKFVLLNMNTQMLQMCVYHSGVNDCPDFW